MRHAAAHGSFGTHRHRAVHAMSELRTADVHEIMARAGKLLSKASACTVKLDDVQVLSDDDRRNFIARAAARDPTTVLDP